MVRQLPIETRRLVLALWLAGYNYRSVSNETGVSLGAITSIIDEEREKVHDLEELRKLRIAIRQAKATPVDALRGATFLEKLNSMSIPTERVQACVSLLDRYGEKAGDVLEAGLRLKEVEASQGKPYEAILAEADETEKQLQDATSRLQNLRIEEETIKKSLQNLDQLKTLSQKISSHNLTTTRLDDFIQQSLTIEELGFTPQTAKILASELGKRGLDPQRAAATTADLLSKHLSLEEDVARLGRMRNELQQEIETKQTQLEGLQKQAETQREQISELRNLAEEEKRIRGQSLTQLKARGEVEKARLEAEIDDLKSKREAATKQIEELKEQRETTLKEKSVELEGVQTYLGNAKTDLTRIEETLTKIRPLAILASIIAEPEAPVEQTLLLKTSLGFLEALKIHAMPKIQTTPNYRVVVLKLEEIIQIVAEELRLATRKPV